MPRAIELYATSDIADLSIYGVGSANNGGGSDGQEGPVLSGQASQGDYIYVATEATACNDFFGFAPDFTGNAPSINGDDVVELLRNDLVVDVFGELGVDGTGQPWEYKDGWASRVDGTGPDGNLFELSNWAFSGPNALDGETTNAGAGLPFPIGVYAAATAVPEPGTLILFGLGLVLLGVVRVRHSRA